LHDPHRNELLNRSVQEPLQQAGLCPVHGAATQEPQWLMSVLRLVHIPEQIVGNEAEHFTC